MGAKISGVQQTMRKLSAVIGDMQGRRAVRAIKSALFIIGPEAARITPRDTSTLVNSQFNEVMVNGTRITGRIGYSANYALYVHNAPGKLKGQPRSHFGKTRSGVEFGGGTGTGNYWDPYGEPQFLSKAAESTRDDVIAVIRKEMSQ
ncbi:HK97 gp10 family phage protein [Pantoea sp. Marseille-Q5743]|uniref:HK97 gp10 family phage protein n=1 Tax=Pantoea sp. Marseille-Q5743 TaxID=2972776 RepID=UPI0021C777B2|nr:HK97 gp10 family phage protein [Pantoea sp. Marseille-Q5743]